ncbi:MAG: lasso peptide biosynthesis B2 protein [Methanobacterium sp.]
MSIFFSFMKLSSREKHLALQSLFWVLRVRLMIWIFPFPQVQKRVQKMASSASRKDSKPDHVFSIHRIRFMIMVASRYVPRATCLVQALAGYIVFSKYGYSTQIKIGVLNEDGVFEAHAWLERGDKVVLGESEKDFRTILDIKKDEI